MRTSTTGYLEEYTTELFMERARKVHGRKYNYDKVRYRGSVYSVEIVCPRHGSFFQSPHLHLQGRGCAYCGYRYGDEVYQYLRRLNKERGWDLKGGNEEFKIPSGLSGTGYYRFDGCDWGRLIFFEYNGEPHRAQAYAVKDQKKKVRLKELVGRL